MTDSTAIRLENLTKTFGRGRKQITAVKGANLTVHTGQVYGFLGPNGAGKTTTIRMILDLMNPTAGTVYVFGRPVRQDRAVLRRAGAIIEGAAFYPYLSGRKNLQVIGRMNGYYDLERIDALLKQVGLENRARQQFKSYSLGMKQRLGLAAALMHDPSLLIMDEPTNGLDPAGIQEMRHFIRELADKHGKTVFLSSHLLNEVEQMCDHVAIINRGEILREGTVSSLLAEKPLMRLQAAPLDRATTTLRETWPVTVEDGALLVEVAYDDVPAMLRRLHEQHIDVYEVTRHKQSLESFFLQVTGDHDGAPSESAVQPMEMTDVR